MTESTKYTTLSEVETIFDSYTDIYREIPNSSVIVSHFGVLTQDLINSLSVGVEDMMASLGDKKHIIKRMFSILIEGLQNIRIHGGTNEVGEQIAFLLISKTSEAYRILLGNIVEEEDRASIKSYLGNINSHDERELKSLFLRVLKDGYLSKKGGAGLGIITMRMKSSNELAYRLYDLSNGKSFLAVQVELNRS